MTNTLKTHDKIHIAMLPALVNNYKTYKLTQYLKYVGHKFTKPPTIKLACNSVRFPKTIIVILRLVHLVIIVLTHQDMIIRLLNWKDSHQLLTWITLYAISVKRKATMLPAVLVLVKTFSDLQKQMSILLTRIIRKDIMKNVQIWKKARQSRRGILYICHTK